MENNLIPIESMIFEIRGMKVMIDSDLARLYDVEAKRLNESVRRNIKRFPEDFMFQLNKEEFEYVVANCDHLHKLKYRPTMPYVFTEQGVSMLAAVLNSDKAIDVNIGIMRAFVSMRKHVLAIGDLNEQIKELRKVLLLQIDYTDDRFKYYDDKIKEIIIALNYFAEEKPKEKRQVGFNTENSTPP